MTDFMECRDCRVRPEGLDLCVSCQRNKRLILDMREQLRRITAAADAYWSGPAKTKAFEHRGGDAEAALVTIAHFLEQPR